MASPHVAGIAALYLQRYPTATPEEVSNSIVVNATRDVLSNIGTGSFNRLAYVGNEWLDSDHIILDGDGSLVAENVQHPNGNVYDQVLMTGSTVRVHSDRNQITRVSWIDLNDDIIMAEYFGCGNLKIILDNYSAPAEPVKYNQFVMYPKGNARFSIEGSSENSYFSVFSVGTANASDQSIFISGMTYDGKADVSLLDYFAFKHTTEKMSMGGILTGNAIYAASSGNVGVRARTVKVKNRLVLGDIKASGSATPYLFIDNSSTLSQDTKRVIIAGGNLIQSNSATIVIGDSFYSDGGFSSLITNGNYNSHSQPICAQALSSARLLDNYTVVQYAYTCVDPGPCGSVANGFTAP